MRTEQEIKHARLVLVTNLARGGWEDDQRAILSGMSVALQWMCGDGGQVLQDLIDGRQIAFLRPRTEKREKA